MEWSELLSLVPRVILVGELGIGVASSWRVSSEGSLASLGVVASELRVGWSDVLVELWWSSDASSSEVGCSCWASR